MGAASANIPAIYLTRARCCAATSAASRGQRTDVWKFWDDARAGLVGDCELAGTRCGIARSPVCMTMGTASTMTSAAEALGMTLPGMASVPAVDSAHYRMAVATGRRAVDMAWEQLTPDQSSPAKAFEERCHRARARRLHQRAHPPDRDGGRAGVELTLDDFDAISRRCPGWRTSSRAGPT